MDASDERAELIEPPIISLRSLREHTGHSNVQTRPCRPKKPHVLGADACCTVRAIEASFKRFGCVCVPVSDLDVSEVCTLFDFASDIDTYLFLKVQIRI